MKKISSVLLCSLVAVMLMAENAEVAAEAPVATAAVTEEVSAPPPVNNNFANMTRGVINIATCAAEIPRGWVYEDSQMPFWGIISGSVVGSGLTIMRCFSGVADIITLGFNRADYFNDTNFQEFVWQSDWVPRDMK